MNPSDVRMWRGVLPLIGTFGRAELEFAAALLVRACVRNGNAWQPIEPRQIGEALKADREEGGCFHHLEKNPFVPYPDFRGLVAGGFAEFKGDPEGTPAAPVAFTDKGLAVLRSSTMSAHR